MRESEKESHALVPAIATDTSAARTRQREGTRKEESIVSRREIALTLTENTTPKATKNTKAQDTGLLLLHRREAARPESANHVVVVVVGDAIAPDHETTTVDHQTENLHQKILGIQKNLIFGFGFEVFFKS